MNFLFEVQYNQQQNQQKGSTSNVLRNIRQQIQQIQRTIQQAGGQTQGSWYSFGHQADLFVMATLPDLQSASQVSLQIEQNQPVSVQVTPLLTTQEVEQIAQQSQQLAYSGSGQ